MATAVHAEDPYTGYSYNAWNKAVPSQNGYIVKDTITGAEMGLSQLSDPTSPLFISEKESATLSDAKDFFLSDKNEFFIVDTGNNRILRLDVNFNLIACYKNFTGSKVTEPVLSASGASIKIEDIDKFMAVNSGMEQDKDGNPILSENDELLLDEFGNIVLDIYGNPAMVGSDVPLMDPDSEQAKAEDEKPQFDENGNPIVDENVKQLVKSVTDLRAPYGIYVDSDDIMYIADRDNQRIIKCGLDCKIITEYTKPETDLYNSQSFYCTKVLVDAAKNVYVICPAVNKGAIMYSPSGNFIGYYGANRVEVTAEVIRNKIWRKFASESQQATLTRATPVEYANFDVDSEGFIYTVTEVANVSTDAVKKLNPAGNNILELTTNAADISFGDQEKVTYAGTTYATRLTDITIGDNGLINILDYTSGRIFQYDRECNLLFIFGCDQEAQKSGFDNPNAIECLGNLIYVLDGRNNDITVFEETLFGAYVHEAVEQFNRGLYEESMDLWLEIIKRDGNYNMAYVALGRAYLNKDDYDNAIKYFKLAFEDEDYDRAFEARRQDMLRDNFTLIVVVIALLVAIWFVIKQLQKKGKIPKKLIKTGIGWVVKKVEPTVMKIVKGGKK